jgi:hypothetical protein
VPTHFSRRTLLQLVPALVPAMALPAARFRFESQNNENFISPVTDTFPTQPPELVREMVTVSHFDLHRVRELVDARPSLARSAWDWGFGDWETALGAASHMGNRPIAEYLLSQGAVPSLFSATMLGQFDLVKSFLAAQPHVQRLRGPHGISLLAHAKAGGESARPVFDFLQSLGDADAALSVPLTDSDLAALAGTYSFGPAPNQQIDLTIDRRQGLSAMYSPLTWTRKGFMGRPLVHLGDRSFHPAGAPAVRILLSEDKDALLMTVHDPGVVLSARRLPPSR